MTPWIVSNASGGILCWPRNRWFKLAIKNNIKFRKIAKIPESVRWAPNFTLIMAMSARLMITLTMRTNQSVGEDLTPSDSVAGSDH
jgi:hypothetical protein